MSDAFASRRLLDQWRQGDDQAARQLFDQYAERLIALSRKRLSQRLASRVDPEDVVQSVFRTFFLRAKEGQFKIEDQDDLCKLLVRITVHKTLRQVEFHQAAKRDPHQEESQGDAANDRLLQALGREPTPDAAASFLDELDHFLGQLRPEDRRILELRLQGVENEEIAAQLGVSDRKIRRMIERLRGLAEQEGLIH